jgi:hypothetical protein
MALFSLLLHEPAQAQEATIVGTVTDPSGAAVPNAAITVTNIDTGVVSHLTTSTGGDYVAADVHIGHYTVRAEATGFKVGEQKGIVLAVGDRIRVDFKLELGTTQQEITVEAAPIAVQSDSGQQGNVVTGTEVTQLATNGRSIYTLATLVPGASNIMADDQGLTSTSGDDRVSFNGLRMSRNIYLVDGAEAYDRGSGSAIQITPSLDSIAEFQVMTPTTVRPALCLPLARRASFSSREPSSSTLPLVSSWATMTLTRPATLPTPVARKRLNSA